VTLSDSGTLLLGLLQGIVVAAVFLLALIAGLSVVLGFPKLRRTTRKGYSRSLDELVGDQHGATYLPPDAPRGQVDQLRAPGT
jgi:hypothetical protein